MTELFGHPFSSYSWKAQIALDEKEIAHTYRQVDPGSPEREALTRLWPLGKFPVLRDATGTYIEATIIVEHADRCSSRGPRLLPGDADAALRVRFMDRVFDNHVMTPMNAVVSEFLRDALAPDQGRIAEAKAALSAIYAWLESDLPGDGWACGDDFTLADCAAAPSLFYADWVHPIAADHPRLRAYRARLLARASVARAVDGGRPFRPYFPPGAPDRD